MRDWESFDVHGVGEDYPRPTRDGMWTLGFDCGSDAYTPPVVAYSADGSTYTLPGEPRLTFLTPTTESEPTMAISPATTDDQILEQIKEAQRRAEALVAELERRKKPQSPGAGRYVAKVRFSGGVKEYEFLLLILEDGRVYTTGGGDSAYFKDWTGFTRWVKNEGVSVRHLQRMETVSTIPCTTVGLA